VSISTDRLPAPSDLATHWDLDPEVVYLNHGSYGACPRAVLEAQSRWRARMEREPVRFFVQDLEGLLDGVRLGLGAFVGCEPESLAFVPNATTAVATVLENLALGEGDEVVATRHEYPACVHNVERACERAGARLVHAELPFPVGGEEEVVEAILSRVTDRTRVALVSHVTSSTAMVLPAARIVRELRERGVETIVDGAHGAGLHELDLDAIGAAWYTSNCHKWLCAPKGAAFLHVREDRREAFRPMILSNQAHTTRTDRDAFRIEFDYVGTNDWSAALAIPDAIEVVGGLVEGGWPGLMARNDALLLEARDAVCARLGTEPPVPDGMLGPMATILLPPHRPEVAERLAARPSKHHDALQDELMERHGIEVPIWSVPRTGERFVRISVQAYNAIGQYRYLAAALAEELERERRRG
jgi:isopenicillin-N epimerase